MSRSIGIAAFVVGTSLIFAASFASAEDLRISGQLNVIPGWQEHKNSGALSTTNQGFISDLERQGGAVAAATTNSHNRDRFNFYLDEFELDLEQKYADNIRLRADIDFSRTRDADGDGIIDGSISMEQGYVSANLAVGRGAELMVGRFNMPIGTEAVDRSELNVVGFSPLRLSGIRPTNGTGAKVFYAFGDTMDLHVYIVNTLADTARLDTNKPIPSGGFRWGFNWGQEEKRSTLGLSGAVGSEQPAGTGGSIKPFTFLGDLDALFAFTSNFRTKLEGIYRQDDSPIGGSNDKFIAALYNMNYDFSDIWDGTFQYSFSKALDGIGTAPTVGFGPGGTTGAQAAIHDFQVSLNYDITDGAKVKLGGNYQLIEPTAGSSATVYGAAAQFAYNF